MEDNTIQQVPNPRKKRLVVEELSSSDEVLIYDLDRHKALCLNQTAAVAWKHCDGKSTVRDILNALNAEQKTLISEDVVWYALKQFGTYHLLEESIKQPVARAGLSRREIIRKAGITAALMLPAVTAIVAPIAAQVASCSALLQPCGVGRPPCCPGLICVQVPVVGCNCNIAGVAC